MIFDILQQNQSIVNIECPKEGPDHSKNHRLFNSTLISMEQVFFVHRGWKDEGHISLAPLQLELHMCTRFCKANANVCNLEGIRIQLHAIYGM